MQISKCGFKGHNSERCENESNVPIAVLKGAIVKGCDNDSKCPNSGLKDTIVKNTSDAKCNDYGSKEHNS